MAGASNKIYNKTQAIQLINLSKISKTRLISSWLMKPSEN